MLEVVHKLYKLTLSPLLGSRCRFFPPCSDYTLEAVRTHGLWRGAWLSTWRVIRCHPWSQGGVDGVPPRSHGR